MTENAAVESVDLIVFRVSEQRFAADASQVARIDRAGHGCTLSDVLGMPKEGTRAVVFGAGEQEQKVYIDSVEGVRTAQVSDLRRVPPAVGAARAVLGLWLEPGTTRPVVLVDLPQILNASEGT